MTVLRWNEGLQLTPPPFLNVRDLGARGDATTDDSGAIQAAIDSLPAGGVVFVPEGTYKISSSIDLASNVSLMGEGAGVSVLQFDSAFGTTGQMLLGTGVSNVRLEKLGIDGNNVGAGGTQTRFASMVAFVGFSSGILLRDLEIYNHEYIGFAFGEGSRDVTVERCEFHTLGYSGTSSNRGVALWLSALSANHPTDVRIRGNYFHDNEWTAVQANVDACIIEGNSFRDNKEAHIYVSRSATDLFRGSYVVIANNTMDGLTRADITAHAMELSGPGFIVTGNHIRNCDHGGISLTSVQYAQIYGNIIGNVSQDSSFWGMIDFVCNEAAPRNNRQISIHDNTFYDDQTTQTSYTGHANALLVGALDEVEIYNNDHTGVTYVGAAFGISSANWTVDSCRRYNNRGTGDEEPHITTRNITTTGSLAITALPFPPKRLEIWAYQASSSLGSASTAVVDRSGAILMLSTASDGSSGDTQSNTTNCVFVRTAGGSTVTAATFTSYGFNAFTINVGTHTGGTTTMRIIAYP